MNILNIFKKKMLFIMASVRRRLTDLKYKIYYDWKFRKTECKTCFDGELYPYYGLAPHCHVGSNIIRSTKIHEKETWPNNFFEDPDVEGCGVYHCPDCAR